VDSSIVVALIGVFSAVLASFLAYQQGKANVRQELQIEYGKMLRVERLESYKLLMKLMKKLPKYPEPIPLSYTELRTLSQTFADWYYEEGGGLFLSKNSREHYFDLQDGIKITLKKHKGEWKSKPSEVKISPWLARELERLDPRWKCPVSLEKIATSEIDVAGDKVASGLLEHVRGLASALRTSMTEDVMTRESAFFESTNAPY
jgi:hypothetical protein